MYGSERYNRNISIDQIGEEGQKALLRSKILVAGAGGLGSGVIVNLASVGIGNIGIVDNDVVELSNLNRQYIHKFKNVGKIKVDSAKEWINDFNSDINVETFNLRLDEENYQEIIKDYDLIIDCFDSYKSKFLLNEIAVKSGKTLIHGGATEFFGQVMTIIPESACLSCLIHDADTGSYIKKGIISPVASVIASIQSLEAVKVLLNLEGILTNKLLTYNGLNTEFKKINVEKNRNCPLCANM